MQNLKTETIELLKEHGKTVDDERFIRASGVEIPLDVFWKEADRNYDDGFGGAEVNGSLMVVGIEWWMERHEYDGSEWWEFKTLPSRPPVADADADFSRLVFSESFFW